MANIRNKISLPIIKRVQLFNFDLYTNTPDIDTTISKEVYCLIGANGLGKSTFLNTITYAITGAIPLIERSFLSAQDYYKNALKPSRTHDYYDGRISESLRSDARVLVELECNNNKIKLERYIFGDCKVSNLTIKENNKISNYTAPEVLSSTIDDIYKTKICEWSGLQDFSQYVFLFHFLMVFDESRHLLLWNDNILTNALYIAFGTDPSIAALTDKLQNEMEKESSRGRNAKFAARQLTQQIDELLKLIKNNHDNSSLTDSEIMEEHKKLKDNYVESQKRTQIKQLQKRELEIKCAELSSKYSALEVQYRKAFSSRLSNISHLTHHPIIKLSIEDNKCALCNSDSTDVSQRINAIISSEQCPLCMSNVSNKDNEDKQALQTLKDIDIDRNKIKHELDSTFTILERVTLELNIAENNEQAALDTMNSFENVNPDLKYLENIPDASYLGSEINNLKNQRDKLNRISKENYEKRDELREKLRIHEKTLKSNYNNYADSFVFRFRELAEEFIGMSVDVQLEHHKSKNNAGFGLTLKMNDKLRPTSDKLTCPHD
ncbi:AAA family ATPase [Enterobacter hormaechei]|uniref:AAA family ATPase n=1 Tax=Enterobacter hormaechei TaxID=158836 RepID=UPI002964A93E|nr:AAA family ATPase [Enterobacter hormaechei]MDW2665708.1 AAA family ATPase [Enterobacter hormaechei]MDW2674987.1 AAA family ATPase [Enterobacter hormaechei]MDW2684276.1 AAA family ATPase [Enterobacter hormaechei]MDW2774498.1 AAA family ATPase [Enterobacter hormaechei]MDX6949418.1 AAA family ATPase [Enterobacter hormaechei]